MTSARLAYCAALACAAIAMAPTKAAATSDEGTKARLIAVAGERGQYAVIVYETQDSCGSEACDVFYVDVTDPELRRRGLVSLPPTPSELPDGDDVLLRRYLAAVGDSDRAQLQRADVGPARHTLALDERHSAERRLVFELHRKGSIEVEIEQQSLVASSAIFDRYGAERCSERAPKCSSCKRVTRTSGGEPIATWACEGVGRFVDGTRDEPCDCSSTGRVVRLRLRLTRTGTSSLGNALLLEPASFRQNRLNGPDDPSEIEVAFAYPVDEGKRRSLMTTVDAHAVPLGILVLGSVVHEPLLNGTYLPVVAFLPLGSKATPSPAPTGEAPRRTPAGQN